MQKKKKKKKTFNKPNVTDRKRTPEEAMNDCQPKERKHRGDIQ